MKLQHTHICKQSHTYKARTNRKHTHTHTHTHTKSNTPFVVVQQVSSVQRAAVQAKTTMLMLMLTLMQQVVVKRGKEGEKDLVARRDLNNTKNNKSTRKGAKRTNKRECECVCVC